MGRGDLCPSPLVGGRVCSTFVRFLRNFLVSFVFTVLSLEYPSLPPFVGGRIEEEAVGAGGRVTPLK
jgi:hypothetical protein